MSKTRQKRGQEHIRKLTRTGRRTSLSLTLPIAIMRASPLTIQDWKK